MRSVLALSLILSFTPFSAHAATQVLSAVADASIIGSLPDNNTGGHTHVASGTSGTLSTRRGLFLFDLTSIPAGSTVTAANLAIDVVGAPSFGDLDSNFDVFRVSRPWGEGAQIGNPGAPAAAGEATWNSAEHLATSWTSAGGDFSGTSSGTAFVTGIATYNFTNAQLVADVQAMIDAPSTNDGWLLRSQLEASLKTARRFGSREGAAAAQLTVEFDPPPAPAPALPGLALGALALGLAVTALRRAR